eukprot:CAMPEP_0195019062 /NCGR_PEP_ID=MMETSP0326_2-20130528/31911_1 /TAXON_ID=2866 ORGANISM="Crypthecodinium cohnii, Strain Seligo" /NCGR_SAMPLE_ID=MMETSP0326_2 /ASSEMBLY_ACC=CAM_ASM_000348 /LENGTH=31 /DNA_ID= /DNA_START= /DNA_END= /DNA_ORIENTATION=
MNFSDSGFLHACMTPLTAERQKRPPAVSGPT